MLNQPRHICFRRHLLVATGCFMLLACAVVPLQAQKTPKFKLNQYKRVHQVALNLITSRKTETAISALEVFAAANPMDAESHYMLTVARAQAGQLPNAIASMNKAIELGLPPERFVAGTRTLLQPIHKTTEYQALATRLSDRVAHGPMLGCLEGNSVRIWLRTTNAAAVRIEAKAEGDDKVLVSETQQSIEGTDFTVIPKLSGLKPKTKYLYRVVVNDKSQSKSDDWHRFHTLAGKGQPVRFKLGFGGGAGYVPQHEHMWNTIAAEKPDAFLLLGDNIYSDAPQSPEMQHYCYYRRQSRPEYRAFTSKTPIYSIWDDHDFGTNDCQGGPAIETPDWKRPVWKVFRNNWVNPAYGGGEKNPGIYYDFYIGNVHFIMLDGRYYRNLNKKDSAKSDMLGPVQLAWLKKTIDGSTGRLKVLCSPVPWVLEAKGESKDTWNGFRAQRHEIFGYLTKNKVTGVVLMSADRHRSDLWKISRENDYSLYEFNSSRLTNQHVHPEMKRAEFSYNKKQSFGTVEFDTTADDPTIRYRIHSIDGEPVFDFTLNASRLR